MTDKPQIDKHVYMLIEAMAAWDEAQTARHETCQRGPTSRDVTAYDQAKEAWFRAQEAPPRELAYEAFHTALAVFNERGPKPAIPILRARVAAGREAGKDVTAELKLLHEREALVARYANAGIRSERKPEM